LNRKVKHMKLTSKNLIYTVVITILLAVMILGYFIWMLPSLYVDRMMEEDLSTVKEIQEKYLRDGTYGEAMGRSAMQLTLEFPFEDEPIKVTSPAFQAEVSMNSVKAKEIFDEMKEELKDKFSQLKEKKPSMTNEEIVDLEGRMKAWFTCFRNEINLNQEFPVQIKAALSQSAKRYQQEGSTKIHAFGERILVLASGARDVNNHYKTYLAVTSEKQRLVVTCYGTMTPQIAELAPVVLSSIPMLIAAIILFALIVSFLYSRGMVEPILRLVHHTKMVEDTGILKNAGLQVKGKDEIAELTQTLNQLYTALDQNLEVLEQKNALLEEKNKSQEVFLRVSSHQLKTPIAAALLLVDGMIHEIGKYKDTKTYLPEVKAQLLSMRKMVEDILYLNHCEERIELAPVDLSQLMHQQIDCHQVSLLEGNYQLETSFANDDTVVTDRNLMEKIVDNLLSNAIHYSRQGAKIRVTATNEAITVFNGDAHIREELLPDIFEPFVSESGKGHGLGLYIVKYYAALLGIQVKIYNYKDGVMTEVLFRT